MRKLLEAALGSFFDVASHTRLCFPNLTGQNKQNRGSKCCNPCASLGFHVNSAWDVSDDPACVRIVSIERGVVKAGVIL